LNLSLPWTAQVFWTAWAGRMFVLTSTPLSNGHARSWRGNLGPRPPLNPRACHGVRNLIDLRPRRRLETMSGSKPAGGCTESEFGAPADGYRFMGRRAATAFCKSGLA